MSGHRPPHRRRRTVWIGALIPTVALLRYTPATAHDPFQITTEARVAADHMDVKIAMSRATAIKLCGRTDAAGNDVAGFEACAPGLYRITTAGSALRARAARAFLTVENDVELSLIYPPPARGPLRFDAVHLARLSDPTYGAELTVTGTGVFLGQQLLRADASTLDIPLPQAGASPGASPSPSVASFGQFLRLGVAHIAGGIDHLLFLLGLLIVCRRFRSVLLIISCFTLAHSITLALAGTGVLALPSRVVEPLIALSIVFVGAENLLRAARGQDPRGRWAVTLVFGLVHGFGLAGALRDVGLGVGGAPIAVPLLAFNLGVELGQLAVAALVLPVIFRLRARPAFDRYGVRAISLLVCGAGLTWLTQRTMFP